MKIRLSARAIILRNSEILLNKMGDGIYYNFPGGQIEENETAPEAVIREVLEETGYTVDIGDYLFTSEYEAGHCNGSEGEGHRINLFFRCRLIDDIKAENPVHPDGEANNPSIKSKPVWVLLSELKRIPLVPSAIRKVLIEYIETDIIKPQYIDCSKASG